MVKIERKRGDAYNREDFVEGYRNKRAKRTDITYGGVTM